MLASLIARDLVDRGFLDSQRVPGRADADVMSSHGILREGPDTFDDSLHLHPFAPEWDIEVRVPLMLIERAGDRRPPFSRRSLILADVRYIRLHGSMEIVDSRRLLHHAEQPIGRVDQSKLNLLGGNRIHSVNTPDRADAPIPRWGNGTEPDLDIQTSLEESRVLEDAVQRSVVVVKNQGGLHPGDAAVGGNTSSAIGELQDTALQLY